MITDWQDMEAWQMTMAHLVFRPQHFRKIVQESMKQDIRLKWIGWDDINIHLPRSMYTTKRQVWEELSRNWEGFRSTLSVFECTAPRKDKVVSFVLADMNWDILNSGRLVSDVQRWMWDRDFYEPEKVNKSSIKVEELKLVRDRVPSEVWKEYWDRRKQINTEETEGLLSTLDSIDKSNQKLTATPSISKCQYCGKPIAGEWNLKMHEMKCVKTQTHP
jgi:hypothetical protein